MEFFERAHTMKSTASKKQKLTERKKKQLKQMLYGYKVNDNKLVQKTTDFQNDYGDSTSISDFSDLDLSNSSYEDEANKLFFVKKDKTKSSVFDNSKDNTDQCFIVFDNNCEDKISSDGSISGQNRSKSNQYLFKNSSSQSNQISDNDSCKDKTCLIDESMSKYNVNIESSESNMSSSAELENEIFLDTGSDFEASIDMNGLNLTESDISESFDGDGQLAAKIQQRLQTNNNKQKHKNKKLKIDNSSAKGQLLKEMCESIQSIEKPFSENEEDSLIKSDILNNDHIDSVMSPPYVSITAIDMPIQRLVDIVGDYKHSTVRNMPSDNRNTILCTNNSGFFIEENMSVDVQTEDDVGSLIPELDDIPKLEEIYEELSNVDTTTESLDKNIVHLELLETETLNDKEQSIDYDNVADTFKVYYGSKCCIMTLKHPCELFIQGKVKIKSLGGSVELFGYTLKKENCDIYAPYYSFAQYVKTVENMNVYYGLFGKLTAAGLSVSEAEAIVTSIGDHDCVIQLEKLQNKAMDFVQNHFKGNNLFSKSNKTVEPYFSKASDILNCSLFSSRPYKSFHVHASWSEALELAENKYSRGIVCGGKGVGKSTYLRYQVNKLLSHGPVLVVDLDPGQSEFTVAGNVSATVVKSPLFGPSFTHLRKPELVLNIGMINIMDNAKRYVSAVQTLIKYCHNNEALSNMAWLINTMGMTNALGLKLITRIITLSKPTYLLQYESKTVKQRFETLLTSPSVKDLFEEYRHDPLFVNASCPEDLEYSFVLADDMDSHLKNTSVLTPRDERYLNFLAYFSELLLTCPGESLLGVTPYAVSIKDLFVATNVIVKEEHIKKVINGKLVALCQHASQCDSARVFTLSDKPLLCLGHGLIRGIDWEKEMLYVITPVPSSELGTVDTLLFADWLPEIVGYESQLPKGTKVPYRTITAEQQKQLLSTPRRRFNPLMLLKMSRNS